MQQLDIKVLSVIDARCNHETCWSSFIFKYFNNSTFFNVVCITKKIKCWVLLMHGVNMEFIFEIFTEICLYISDLVGFGQK